MPSTGRVWNTVSGTSPVPGGHIHKQEVYIPHDFLPELLNSTGNHGAAPYHRGLGVIQQQVDAHDLNAGAAADRINALAVSGGRALHAKQAGDGGAGNISIQHAGFIAQAAHRNSQHGAGHAFANTALAGNDADDLADAAFRVRRLMFGGTVIAVRLAAAAIMGTFFTHSSFCSFKFRQLRPSASPQAEKTGSIAYALITV